MSQPLRGLTIGIIGAGKMGQALIRGLLAEGLSRSSLVACDADPSTRRHVSRRFRIRVLDDARRVARGCDILLLAVKPQQVPELLDVIGPHIARRQTVVSIAAGITLRWLQQRLPGIPLVRVMPNLPATVGCGFAAFSLGRHAGVRQRAEAWAIFGAVGQAVELPERHLDAVTAVSGSGPAYLFYLVQAWEEAARALGLPPTAARRAIRQTLTGSLALLHDSQEAPEALIAKVASKGGTTEAALQVLARRHVSGHFVEAVRAAARRSRQLAWG